MGYWEEYPIFCGEDLLTDCWEESMMDAMETLKSIYKMNTSIKCFINKKINNT